MFLQIMKEYLEFLKQRKKLWLIPLLLILGLASALIVFGQAGGALAPFIYTLF